MGRQVIAEAHLKDPAVRCSVCRCLRPRAFYPSNLAGRANKSRPRYRRYESASASCSGRPLSQPQVSGSDVQLVDSAAGLMSFKPLGTNLTESFFPSFGTLCHTTRSDSTKGQVRDAATARGCTRMVRSRRYLATLGTLLCCQDRRRDSKWVHPIASTSDEQHQNSSICEHNGVCNRDMLFIYTAFQTSEKSFSRTRSRHCQSISCRLDSGPSPSSITSQWILRGGRLQRVTRGVPHGSAYTARCLHR